MKVRKGHIKINKRISRNGMGNIVIPDDIPRNKYIRDCFMQKSVAIFVDGFGVISNVLVAKGDFSKLDFPQTPEELGSPVLYESMYNSNQIIVSKVFYSNDEVSAGEDGIQVFSQSIGGNTSSVVLNGKTGVISMYGSGGVIIGSVGDGSNVDIESSGGVSIRAKEFVNFDAGESMKIIIRSESGANTSIKYVDGKGFHYADEFGNEIIANKNSFGITSKSINLGDGKEPIILGNKLVKLLGQIIDGIAGITVTTSLGAMPILNLVQIKALKKSLNGLKSKLSSTD